MNSSTTRDYFVQDLIKGTKRRLSLVDSSDMSTMPSSASPPKMHALRACKQAPPALRHPSKRVRFSEFSSLTMFPKNSKEEAHRAWHSKQNTDDCKLAIRDQTVVLRNTLAVGEVEKLAHSILIPSEYETHPSLQVSIDICDIRGLEHLVSGQCLKLIFNRRKMVKARVLQEQRMQRTLGVNDEARLAQVSKKYSKFAREWSHAIANARAD